MSNTFLGLSTKVLILSLLLSSVYYFDVPRWMAELVAPQAQTVFLFAVTAFVLGAIVGRRTLRILLENSETGFARGMLLVSLSALLYFFGSYSPYANWLHYESLIALVLGYLTLRVGVSFVKSMSPLFIVLALALQPTGIPPLDSRVWVFLLSVAIVTAYVFRFGRRPNQLFPVLLMITIAIVARLQVGNGEWGYLRFLIPLPISFLIVPKFRRYIESSGSSVEFPCDSHRPVYTGFCSKCGKKVRSSSTPENYGGWGLAAICALTLLVILPSMPLLALGGGVYEASYTARGVSLTALPATPQGWQINSTLLDSWNQADKTLETVRVYVPTVHPETNNYTVYYSVSSANNVKVPPWRDVAAWKWIRSDFVPMAGIQGRVTTYVYGNNTIFSYAGSRTMTFVDGLGFSTKTVTVGYLKVFKNLDIPADKSSFLGELGAVWTPPLAVDSFRSDWTAFTRDTIAGFQTTLPLVEVAASVSVFGWVGYKVIAAGEDLDKIFWTCSLVSDKKWFVLNELQGKPQGMARGMELGRSAKRLGVEEVDSTIRSLEEDGLVRQRMVSTDNDILLFWKARV